MPTVVDPTSSGPAALGDPRAGRVRREVLRDYYHLTKPGITRLVVLTTAVGFYMASAGALDVWRLLHAIIGTGLVASGSGAINQYAERDVDALMPRTRNRPVPAGRISPRAAATFGYSLAVAGLVYLAAFVNWLTVAVVAASFASYVYVYTPLKLRTTAATIVGTIPGALPIVAGWTAAGAPLDVRAAVLFGIVGLWQIPHFLALAWMCRDDYRAAGMVMISNDDEDGRQTAGQVVNYAVALLLVGLLPTVLGMTGTPYFVGAFLLGGGFLALGVAFLLRRDARRARLLFFGSVLYLPLILVLMAVDKAGA